MDKPILTLIVNDNGNYVRLTEFYDTLELDKESYHRFVDKKLKSNIIPQSGRDFIEIPPKKNGQGRPRQEFLISISLVKTFCFELNSVRAKYIKSWADTIMDFRQY